MIHVEQKSDGTHVRVNNHLLAVFTRATEQTAIARFVELATAREPELAAIGAEYEERLAWNWSQSKGKDWPVFRRRERVVSELCKQAGIKNT